MFVLFSAVTLLAGCEDDYESDADDHAILLTHSEEQIKSPGLYRRNRPGKV